MYKMLFSPYNILCFQKCSWYFLTSRIGFWYAICQYIKNSFFVCRPNELMIIIR